MTNVSHQPPASDDVSELISALEAEYAQLMTLPAAGVERTPTGPDSQSLTQFTCCQTK
jgi:hypothetical protein